MTTAQTSVAIIVINYNGAAVLDDLAASLANAFRSSITFNRVKVLVIKLADQTGQASSISIGGAGSNGFITPFGDATDIIKVLKGGSAWLIAANLTAMAVTAGTGDKLKILNNDGDNTATYQILLLGNKP